MDKEAMDKADPGFEERLRAYYQVSYDESRRPLVTWQSIAGQLGDQVAGEPVEITRTIDRPYTRNGYAAGDAEILPKQSEVRQHGRKQRHLWTPAVAATLVLALGGIVIALLAAANTLGQPVSKALFIEDFEKGLGEWALTSNINGEYRADIDNVTVHGGNASAYIEPDVTDPTNMAWLMRDLDVKIYLNKRIRFSAYVKTENANTWATLGVGILGQPVPTADKSPSHEKILGMDNMEDRPILGKTDWQRYDIVLDVPADITKMHFSLNAGGKGRVWVDDIRFEVADGNVPVTNVYRHMEPANLGFEEGLSRWLLGSPNSYNFEVKADTQGPYEGRYSGLIGHLEGASSQGSFHDLHQIVRTDNYKGERVRLSAYIKTEGVGNRGIMYLGISGPSGASLDTAITRPDEISGMSNWQKYELVLDVPQDSYSFYMAVGLEGKGKLWVDNVQFEVVGKDVPLTNAPARP
jgi:hypothetical protein